MFAVMPSITFNSLNAASIERALSALRTGQSLGDHPLSAFISIQQSPTLVGMVDSRLACQLAIFDHLIALIVDNLNRLRSLLNLPVADTRCEQYLLATDFSQANVELEAWSVLYHRYVCANRDLSLQQIAGNVHQHVRTIRRRHQHGITRLTEILIRDERIRREANTRQTLKLALPRSYPPRLYWDRTLLDTALHVMQDGDPPHHLNVHGPPGIGKTTLALAIAHNLIERESIDDLLWVEVDTLALPDTPHDRLAAIMHEILSRLRHVSDQTEIPAYHALRSYLFAQDVLIILDGADSLLDEPTIAEKLHEQLDTARLIVASRQRAPEICMTTVLMVPELTRSQASVFMEQYESQRFPNNQGQASEVADALYDLVGGNPQTLIVAWSVTRNLPDSERVIFDEVNALYKKFWERLDSIQQQLCWLAFLFGDSGLTLDVAQQVMGETHALELERALIGLVEGSLLSIEQWRGFFCYRLLTPLRVFILANFSQTHDRQLSRAVQFVERTLEILGEILTGQSHMILSVLGRARELDISAHRRFDFLYRVRAFLDDGLSWNTFLLEINALVADCSEGFYLSWLFFWRGVCHRHLGHFVEAAADFHRALAIIEAGNDDLLQAHILVEIAVIERYRLNWVLAEESALAAMTRFEASAHDAGLQRCLHELAQVAIEQQNPERSLALMTRVESRTARTWDILCQAYLALGYLEQAQQAALTGLEYLTGESTNAYERGRMLGTLARVYAQKGEIDLAVQAATTSLDLLQQAQDVIGYARASNNLAALYIQQPDSHQSLTMVQIRELLFHARDVLARADDKIGLTTTLRNLELVNGL